MEYAGPGRGRLRTMHIEIPFIFSRRCGVSMTIDTGMNRTCRMLHRVNHVHLVQQNSEVYLLERAVASPASANRGNDRYNINCVFPEPWHGHHFLSGFISFIIHAPVDSIRCWVWRWLPWPDLTHGAGQSHANRRSSGNV